MRIVVDARHLAYNRGVARYARCMLQALAERHPDDEWIAFVPGASRIPPVHERVVVVGHPLPGRLLYGAAALTGRPAVDRLAGGADVVWAPAPAPLAVSPRVPLVLTVHDLSWERRRDDFTAYERVWHRLADARALARRATAVVVDGDAVAAEVATAWPEVAGRLRVVVPGLGLDVRESEVPAPHPVAPDRYLLYVGALEPRKGIDVLARAFAAARRRGLDADLAVVGSGRMDGALDGAGIHLLGTVGDHELDALYAGALALVLPSWLEGFGMPPLEAAARGTPSVVSDLPALAESIGDGALRVPAGDERAWADALVRVASDPDLRARLAIAGGATAARYDWGVAADRLRAVLAEATG